MTDTRIPALATDVSRYAFEIPRGEVATIRVRLVFRRAFQQLMEWKGWEDPDVLLAEQTILVVGFPEAE